MEKRGRKPMSDEEKILAKAQRDLKKKEIKEFLLSDADVVFSIVSDLNKAIKKNIDKLSSTEVSKLKSTLNASVLMIDLTLTEKVEKEKSIKKAKLEKELEAIQKELSVL